LRFLFLPAAIVALVAQCAVLWAVIAGRAPASSRHRSARWADIAWVVLPTVALIVVLAVTWRSLNRVPVVSDSTGITA
jgi:heme/copper-type cytochrome/quinol oxidase subunit 2